MIKNLKKKKKFRLYIERVHEFTVEILKVWKFSGRRVRRSRERENIRKNFFYYKIITNRVGRGGGGGRKKIKIYFSNDDDQWWKLRQDSRRQILFLRN